MKKILLLLTAILLICGCETKKNTTVVDNKTEEQQEDVLLETKEIDPESNANSIVNALMEIGNKIYENKEYESFTKINDIYFISLDDLKTKYSADISAFEGMKCKTNEAGLYFDIDNKLKLEYDGESNPITLVLNDCELPE